MVKTVFASGSFYMSSGVASACNEDPAFGQFVNHSLKRHLNCDFGDLDPEDRAANFQALENGSRIFSVYKPLFTIGYYADKIYIITEADRSATTVIFPYEY